MRTHDSPLVFAPHILSPVAATLGRALGGALVMALAVHGLRAQAPTTPFVVGGLAPSSTGTYFGYGDSSDRFLCRTPSGAIGWFNAVPGGSFAQLIDPFAALTVSSIVWERSGPTTAPAAAYFVQDSSGGFAYPILYKALVGGGVLPVIAPSTNPMDDFVLDAVRNDNGRFFMRRTNPTLPPAVVSCTTTTPATPVLSTALPPLGRLTLSPSGIGLAYASIDALGTRFVTVLTPVTASPISKNFPAPSNSTIEDVAWVDDRFLVCRIAPFATPLAGKIVRIDTFQATTPAALVDLTGAAPTVSSLAVSGDRQWLTFIMDQAGGTPERCAAAMHVNVVNGVSPGGAYTVLMPLSQWVFLQAPRIQQTFNPLNPNILIAGRPSGGTDSFHLATMLRDVSCTGRGIAGPSTTFTIDAHHGSLDDMWVLGVTVARTPTGPVLVDLNAGVLVGPFFLTPSTLSNTSQTFTAATQLGQRIFFQAGWFSQGNLQLGRVTELPFF